MEEPTTEQQKTPAIADFANSIASETEGQVDWQIYENEVFAQVFEFEGHRRLQMWEERDFMGELDGYSWQEQTWSGSSWVDTTDESELWNVRHVYEQDLRQQLDRFRVEAEATRPDRLTPTEASLDRITRRALGAVAALEDKVTRLEGKLAETNEKLQQTEGTNTKITGALITLGRRIAGSREPVRTSPEQTGPATATPADSSPSLDR